MGEHDRLARPDRGQSESTGVILIVLIAFILGTSVAAFAFTTFQQESGTAPNVAFGYNYEDVDSDSDRELQLVIESESGGIEDGNGFEGEHVHLVCKDGASCSAVHEKPLDAVATGGGGGGPDGRFIAGDTIALEPSEVGDDTELRIRWEEPNPQGKTVIVGAWRGPDA
ncbi:type IV pilin N-terminal domain-containing protein [Haloglomus halophilum]|uniref:type IV pilin N-terminal domain-containing protein n=1 Tax=Haloglomus halophilum TaxID=2962672 RepID=UPI0020C98EB9|nr:type IV pilin N-terminal domain-containing protein [Haloglomus halophilum]